MPRRKEVDRLLSRRAILKGLGVAPLLLRASPFFGASYFEASPAVGGEPRTVGGRPSAMGFSDDRFVPHYPAKSPLEDVLRLVPPGSDGYVTEQYAFEMMGALDGWSSALCSGTPADFLSRLESFFAADAIEFGPMTAAREQKVRSYAGIEVVKRTFADGAMKGKAQFLAELRKWLEPLRKLETAEFQIIELQLVASAPVTVGATIRYDLVGERTDRRREERIGKWQTEWVLSEGGSAQLWRVRRWKAIEETRSLAAGPMFIDVTEAALGTTASYREQLLRGSDDWRTVLDGACGIDVYGNNGLAVGDFDNDGFDDLYVCQPSGLPNRLYRNRGDGSFEDVTEKAGLDVLDGTSCALFADFRNKGLQDLLVVCGSGPLLFLNQGDGSFKLKPNAFKFARPAQGSFTHAALSDYDGDGRLDIYFCLYSYYLGLDQYHYPVPYFDARNGPPNFLFHNEGDGNFVDRTEAAGLHAENDRYSFACAWGKSHSESDDAAGTKSFHDLYVANDFGRNNLYRNNGDGTFTAVSGSARVEDVGAGMSACWSDMNNDGRQDIYVSNMWSAAGLRVSSQQQFHEQSSANVRRLYQRHAGGDALYRNQGDGTFENVSAQAGADMGRWAWSSDFWDFDHDGFPDLYVANGYITAPKTADAMAGQTDLGSFFWRQVVGRSPDDGTPNLAYERGWQALNELIRADSSWNGRERNVMLANNGDGTFSEVSGITGLDFVEDGRSFVLADVDHDGRLEVVLKNRNAPQVRVLHNAMQEIGNSIAFRLRGVTSNRDAIGTAVTVEAGQLRQTKYLQAGSGFLAQHTKELFFGVGKSDELLRATVRWPGGLTQHFESLPASHRIELTEGSATFDAKPFAASSSSYSQAGPPTRINELSGQSGTWLIEPLRAPDFSLPDSTGRTQQLSKYQGKCVLIHFWATTSRLHQEQLGVLEKQWRVLAALPLTILAVNLDPREKLGDARDFLATNKFSFPVMFSTDEMVGVYNIIYRYLFDRRRDLSIPSSFLVDADGMIVKLYQGQIETATLLQDAKRIPTTPADRTQKALPFKGKLYRDSFQRNDFTYGVAMFQHGYLEQAEASFQEVIRAKPDYAEGYYNLGTLSLRKNDFDDARKYLETSLKLRPEYPEAWNNLGMMAAQQGRTDEAIADFNRSLELRPTYATALLNLGNVYRRAKEFAKAEDALTRAWQLQPDDPEANYSLGMFYAQQDQLQKASEYLQKAVALRPGYPEALNNLGVLLVRQQEYAGAEKEFTTCIAVAPSFDQSYINLARLYMLENDKARAEETLQQLLQQQPQNQNAIHLLEVVKGTQ
jgi:Flp pilus assembly protein TadD/peroxiredoxin